MGVILDGENLPNANELSFWHLNQLSVPQNWRHLPTVRFLQSFQSHWHFVERNNHRLRLHQGHAKVVRDDQHSFVRLQLARLQAQQLCHLLAVDALRVLDVDFDVGWGLFGASPIDGKAQFNIDAVAGGSSLSVTSAAAIPLTAWVHLAAVGDSRI